MVLDQVFIGNVVVKGLVGYTAVMNPAALTTILSEQAGCKKDGNRFVISDEVGVTIFASAGNQTLTIEGIKELALQANDTVVLKTGRGDCYAFLCEDLRALHVKPGKRNSPGY